MGGQDGRKGLVPKTSGITVKGMLMFPIMLVNYPSLQQ